MKVNDLFIDVFIHCIYCVVFCRSPIKGKSTAHFTWPTLTLQIHANRKLQSSGNTRLHNVLPPDTNIMLKPLKASHFHPPKQKYMSPTFFLSQNKKLWILLFSFLKQQQKENMNHQNRKLLNFPPQSRKFYIINLFQK